MKQCPKCGTTYTDVTLRFCLSDGSPLNETDEQQTVLRQTHAGPTPRDVLQDTSSSRHHQTATAPSGSGGLLKVLLVLFGLGLVIVVVALIGTLAYYNLRQSPSPNNIAETKTPPASPSAAKDDNNELRDQIANLQKQLAEQKNANRPSSVPVSAPDLSKTTMTKTARANSPGDGFLALRSLPSAEIGDRLVKIPHGAALQIGACGPLERSVHPGRWCQARYNGLSGYVYDYYVTY